MEIKIILTILLTALAGFGVAYYVGNNILLKNAERRLLNAQNKMEKTLRKRKFFKLRRSFFN